MNKKNYEMVMNHRCRAWIGIEALWLRLHKAAPSEYLGVLW